MQIKLLVSLKVFYSYRTNKIDSIGHEGTCGGRIT
jgi:hypothetical protein